MTDTISTLAQKLRPHWLRDVANVNTTTGGGVTGVTDHGALTGLLDDDHTQYLTPARGDVRYLTATRTLTAGAGLTGGGDLTADRTFTVGAGAGITVNADDVALTTPGTLTLTSTNTATGSHTHAITSSNDVGTTPAASILASNAQGGLQLNNGFFVQGAQSSVAFLSGFAGSGWRADYGVTTASRASIETDDLTVRGRMRVYELLIQQIRATNGSVLVTSSSKVVSASSSVNPAWTVNGSQLTLNGSNATLTFTLYTITTSTSDEDAAAKRTYHGFLTGDIIRAQQVEWNGSAFGGVIQSNLEVTSVTNLYTYKAAYVSGDVPAIGYDFVRLGNSSDSTRRGAVYLTSDDSAAPFIDIVDNIYTHADWNSAGTIKARLGKLSGITDADFGGALSGYGLYSQNVYLKGNIYATSGQFTGTVYASAGAFTGAITATSGSFSGVLSIGASGGVYQGSGSFDSPTTGLKIWNDSSVGRIGGYNTGDLQWFTSTSGYMYAGRSSDASTAMGYDVWGIRLARDGIRMLAEATDSFIQNTSVSSIKWVYNNTYNIDATFTTALNFSSLYAYNATTAGIVYTGLTSFVGSDNYSIKDATIYLSAQHYTGSVYKGVDFTLTCVRSTGLGYAYCSADEFQLAKALKFNEMSEPANPAANTALVFTKDNGSGKTQLCVRFASGATIAIATEA